LQITLEQYEIEAAIKDYMQTQFGIKAVGVTIGGTKGKFTAAITMDGSTKVTLGSAELEILHKVPAVKESPFVSDQAGNTEAGAATKEVVEKKVEPLKAVVVEPKKEVVVEDKPAVKANPLFAAQPAATEEVAKVEVVQETVVADTDELVEEEALPAANTSTPAKASADTLFAPQPQ